MWSEIRLASSPIRSEVKAWVCLGSPQGSGQNGSQGWLGLTSWVGQVVCEGMWSETKLALRWRVGVRDQALYVRVDEHQGEVGDAREAGVGEDEARDLR